MHPNGQQRRACASCGTERYSQGTPKVELRRACASSWQGVSFCIISITAVILCTPPPSCRAPMNARWCRAGGWSGRLAHRRALQGWRLLWHCGPPSRHGTVYACFAHRCRLLIVLIVLIVRAWTALTPAACIASATCGQKLSSARGGRSPVAVLRGGMARQRAARSGKRRGAEGPPSPEGQGTAQRRARDRAPLSSARLPRSAS